MTKLNNNSSYGRLNINSLDLEDIRGKRITITADYKLNTSSKGFIQFWTTSNLALIELGPTNNFKEAILTYPIPNNITTFEIRFVLNDTSKQNDVLEIKNIRITIP